MKRILPLLLAIALPAFAVETSVDWFDVGIKDYDSWPSDGSDKVVQGQGTWTGTANATLDVANHVLELDGTVEFEPVESRDTAAAEVVFFTTNTLTAVHPVGGLEPLESKIKGALAVAADGSATNFYGWAKDPAGATNVWRALSGVTPERSSPET